MAARLFKACPIRRRVAPSREEDAASFATVRWRRGKRSNHRSKSPLLHVRFNKDKTGLSEIDMNTAWPICTQCREKIPTGETSECILGFTTISREENCAVPRPVSDADHIAFLERRTERHAVEWIVVRFVSAGMIGDTESVETREAEIRIGFSSEADRDTSGLWKIE